MPPDAVGVGSAPRVSRLPATAALVAATAAWGSTFLVTKQTLDELSPPAVLTWRFGLAAAVLVLARPAKVLALSGTERRRATVVGLFLGTGFLLQTVGLETTDAGTAGFLTGVAVIATPVAARVVFGERVEPLAWASVAVAALGVWLLAGGPGGVTAGALLTLAGALGFTGHITCLSQWATPGNAYGLTGWSVAVAALLCAAAGAVSGALAGPGGTGGSGVSDGLAVPSSAGAWVSVAYLALVATCLGFVVQAWAQSQLNAAAAAVVMTMEPVFAALLAVTVGGESLAVIGWLGGALVVASMFLTELGPRGCCDVQSPRLGCC
jgi:drug/metabolite transporter (DMT)-like permease